MTATELIAERERMGKTQEEMANFLNGTSVHTYRKWEQGVRKVPTWVPSALIPKEYTIGPLTLDELNTMDQIARRRGITMSELVGEFIKEGLKKLPMIALLSVIAWQAFGHDNSMARKLGGRRRDEAIAGVVDLIDGGEG